MGDYNLGANVKISIRVVHFSYEALSLHWIFLNIVFTIIFIIGIAFTHYSIITAIKIQ